MFSASPWRSAREPELLEPERRTDEEVEVEDAEVDENPSQVLSPPRRFRERDGPPVGLEREASDVGISQLVDSATHRLAITATAVEIQLVDLLPKYIQGGRRPPARPPGRLRQLAPIPPSGGDPEGPDPTAGVNRSGHDSRGGDDRKKQKLDKFDGTTLIWPEFHKKFAILAKLNRWNYEECGAELAMCLEGEPFRIWNGIMSTCVTYC